MGSSKKSSGGSIFGSLFFWILVVPWIINTCTNFHIGIKNGVLFFSTNKDAAVNEGNDMDDISVQDHLDDPGGMVEGRKTTEQLQRNIKESPEDNDGDIGPQTEEF